MPVTTSAQPIGKDALGQNAYATILTPTENGEHVEVVNRGTHPVTVSFDGGTTEHMIIPGNAVISRDKMKVGKSIAIKAKNTTTDSHYTDLSISVW